MLGPEHDAELDRLALAIARGALDPEHVAHEVLLNSVDYGPGATSIERASKALLTLFKWFVIAS